MVARGGAAGAGGTLILAAVAVGRVAAGRAGDAGPEGGRHCLVDDEEDPSVFAVPVGAAPRPPFTH
jgi:hypothetical protein